MLRSGSGRTPVRVLVLPWAPFSQGNHFLSRNLSRNVAKLRLSHAKLPDDWRNVPSYARKSSNNTGNGGVKCRSVADTGTTRDPPKVTCSRGNAVGYGPSRAAAGGGCGGSTVPRGAAVRGDLQSRCSGSKSNGAGEGPDGGGGASVGDSESSVRKRYRLLRSAHLPDNLRHSACRWRCSTHASTVQPNMSV